MTGNRSNHTAVPNACTILLGMSSSYHTMSGGPAGVVDHDAIVLAVTCRSFTSIVKAPSRKPNGLSLYAYGDRGIKSDVDTAA
jgi:hypothetical protein